MCMSTENNTQASKQDKKFYYRPSERENNPLKSLCEAAMDLAAGRMKYWIFMRLLNAKLSMKNEIYIKLPRREPDLVISFRTKNDRVYTGIYYDTLALELEIDCAEDVLRDINVKYEKIILRGDKK